MNLKGIFEFIGVDFKYPNLDKPSLKNLNLEIKKITGIKGTTGSGKSTLIALLMGLLKPNKGEIKFDKYDIYQINKSLAKNLGYMCPQTINLLDDTIKNNICFGVNEKEIDLDRLNEVIEISGIKDFINSKKN